MSPTFSILAIPLCEEAPCQTIFFGQCVFYQMKRGKRITGCTYLQRHVRIAKELVLSDSLVASANNVRCLAMMNRNAAFLVVTYLLLATYPGIAADLESLMNECNDCHGDQGVSQWSDVPTIAGLAEFVHADALYIYRDKERPCTDSAYRMNDTSRPETNMCAISAELSDEQIDAVAAAYAALPYVHAQQDFDASLVAAGKAVHDKGCDRCHSMAGTDPEDEAGMLGGQQMGYLRNTFKEYAEDARYQPEKMKEAMDALSADDVEALLNYYASEQCADEQ